MRKSMETQQNAVYINTSAGFDFSIVVLKLSIEQVKGSGFEEP
jgi:hypothetical protein